jgi:hypothetical protein
LESIFPGLSYLSCPGQYLGLLLLPKDSSQLNGSLWFLVDNLYFLSTSHVLGSNTSASLWEPFQHAIPNSILIYFSRDNLVEKHKDLLNALKWDDKPLLIQMEWRLRSQTTTSMKSGCLLPQNGIQKRDSSASKKCNSYLVNWSVLSKSCPGFINSCCTSSLLWHLLWRRTTNSSPRVPQGSENFAFRSRSSSTLTTQLYKRKSATQWNKQQKWLIIIKLFTKSARPCKRSWIYLLKHILQLQASSL